MTNLNSLGHGKCVHRPQRDSNPVPPGSESTTLPKSYTGIYTPNLDIPLSGPQRGPAGTLPTRICICILRGSTHYCAIAPRVLSHHIVDFLGSRRMETAATSIEVILRPTLVQSDEPSDLRVFSEPHDTTSLHACQI